MELKKIDIFYHRYNNISFHLRILIYLLPFRTLHLHVQYIGKCAVTTWGWWVDMG
jgi:hypothetical protein